LLASLPHVGQRKSRLPSIPGRVPSAHEMPAGCRFGPRCVHAIDVCARPQDLDSVGARHVRCIRHGTLALMGATA
jgi:peptide/nickel transport system ATP-binding protein